MILFNDRKYKNLLNNNLTSERLLEKWRVVFYFPFPDLIYINDSFNVMKIIIAIILFLFDKKWYF